MNALLVRIGADQSHGGGAWNGPVDSESHEYAYVAIPETWPVHDGMQRPYAALVPVLARFGVTLPKHLAHQHMHLDPDFDYLTYGDQGERAKQMRSLQAGDLVVFYAGLRSMRRAGGLIYALIGLLVVDELIPAVTVPHHERDRNAHTRRVLGAGAMDLIVRGRAGVSGRLMRCVPIGEYRDKAYRVRRDILDAWGGLSVRDGYLQRSARLPRILKPGRFMRWLEAQEPQLLQANNT